MSNKQEDISFKEIVLKFRAWVYCLRKSWLKLLIWSFLGMALGFAYAKFNKPKYKADLSFVLSSDARGAGGLMGIASQFGMDIGGSNTDAFSGENIISLMTSQRMIKNALFKKPFNSDETLLNLFVKHISLDKKWSSDPALKSSLPFPEDISKVSLTQDSLIREVYNIIVKQILSIVKPDKKQSIYQVTVNSGNELFSVYLTKYIVNETANFYIATKTKVAKQNLEMLQHEADSLRLQLGGAIRATGDAVDQTFNLNPALQVNRANAQKGQINVTVISTAYGEVIKNLEIAKITLQKETPLFQIIDEPVMPLKIQKAGKVKSLLIGGMLAFIIGALIITSNLLFKSLMVSE